MIYGWGRKNKSWAMPDGRHLVCDYNYFSLLFIIRLVWKRRWHVVGNNRDMDQQVTREQLAQIYGDQKVPDLGLFERFGIFFVIGGIVVLGLLSAGFQALTGDDGSTTETANAPVAAVVSPEPESGEIEPLTDSTVAEAAASAGDPAVEEQAVAEGAASDAAQADTDADAAVVQAEADDGAAEASEAPTPPVSYQQAVEITLVSDTDFASTNVGSPTQGWSRTWVHGAFSTTGPVGELAPPVGEKIVGIEYQLLGVSPLANVQSSAFRLFADELQYSSVAPRINDVSRTGGVFNSVIYFSVPEDATTFRFEMGTLDPLEDGFQAAYELTFEDADPPADPERYTAPDAEHSATLISEDNVASGVPANPSRSPYEIDVLSVVTTARIEAETPDPGFKFLLVEVEALSLNLGNLQTAAFRVSARGELYGVVSGVSVNELLQAGEVVRLMLPFQVPSSVEELEFEVGVPETFDEGQRAAFQVDLAS